VVLFGLSFLLLSCNQGTKKEDLTGQWKVTDFKTELQGVPVQLIENAKTIALSTSYDFNPDMTYSMTIARNALEEGRKHTGTYKIEGGEILLNPDSLWYKSNSTWTATGKNNFNSPMFEKSKLTVEKNEKNRLIISTNRGEGKISYTLERIE